MDKYDHNRGMNVSLTQKQKDYIARQIEDGDCHNASERVRDALRMHLHYREKLLAALKADLKKGLNSKPLTQSIDEIIENIIATKGRIQL